MPFGIPSQCTVQAHLAEPLQFLIADRTALNTLMPLTKEIIGMERSAQSSLNPGQEIDQSN
jgi:hypothetical protein